MQIPDSKDQIICGGRSRHVRSSLGLGFLDPVPRRRFCTITCIYCLAARLCPALL